MCEMIARKLSKSEFLDLLSAFENFCLNNHSEKHQVNDQIVIFSKNEFISGVFSPKRLVELLENNSLVERQQTGTVFTPDAITYEIVSLVLFKKMNIFFAKIATNHSFLNFESDFWTHFINWAEKVPISLLSNFLDELFEFFLSGCTILDPAVGGGSFIFTIFLKYLEFYILLYPYKLASNNLPSSKISLLSLLKEWNQYGISSSIQNRFEFLLQTYQKFTPSQQDSLIQDFLTTINKNIYCFDIDLNAIRVTQIRLHCLLKTVFGKSAMKKNSLSIHALTINFLSSSLKDLPSHFDIILGNPPYIGSDTLAKFYPNSHHKDLKIKFHEVVQPGSKPDLYFYFIKQSIDLLAKDGIVCFIIPNRILSNTYAQKLREYLFSLTQIEFVITFSDKLVVFPSANVHPCIILLSKLNEHRVQEDYLTKHFTGLEKIDKKGWALGINKKIPLILANKYNLILNNLSSNSIQFLEKMSTFSPLKSFLHIREGTRLARFKSKYPPNFPYRISKEEWCNLPTQEKSQYLAEIRGKQIKSYYILQSPFYLALPNLILSNGNFSKRFEWIEKYSMPTIYIRELGKKIFASYYDCKLHPSIGYGGVYFFQYADFTKNFVHSQRTSILSPSDLLLAFLEYFSSALFLKLYRLLFTTGSWGNALKFRSSYFAQIPFVPFNYTLFSVFGHILKFLHHPLSLQFAKKVENPKFFIKWIEKIRENLLIGRIYSQEVPSTTNFEKLLLSSFALFHFLKNEEYSIEIMEKLLDYLSRTLLKISNYELYGLFFKEVSNCGCELAI